MGQLLQMNMHNTKGKHVRLIRVHHDGKFKGFTIPEQFNYGIADVQVNMMDKDCTYDDLVKWFTLIGFSGIIQISIFYEPLHKQFQDDYLIK